MVFTFKFLISKFQMFLLKTLSFFRIVFKNSLRYGKRMRRDDILIRYHRFNFLKTDVKKFQAGLVLSSFNGNFLIDS